MPTTEFLTTGYNDRLVVLSLALAIAAAYTAFDMVGRIRAADRRHVYSWLTAGALAMGTGIWSMHFIGMLALELPIDMGYDAALTGLSWLVAVFGSAVALLLTRGPARARWRFWAGSGALASCILGMHFVGMRTMHIEPGIVYNPGWIALAGVIAVIGSGASLKVSFASQPALRLQQALKQIGAASLAGLAVSGTHYMAMAGANFPLHSVSNATIAINPAWLAVVVGMSALLLIGMAMAAAAMDRRHENSTAELVQSLSRANAQLRHTSRHDSLTGLANRYLLKERIADALTTWQQHHRRFAVVYLDLDGFKSLNDNLGHDVGDQLLCRVAAAMKQTVRYSDTVARIGGDEFLILANGIADSKALDQVCRSILTAVLDAGAEIAQVSASVGSALCPDDGEAADALITAADQAMYTAKCLGKNRHARYETNMAHRAADDFQLRGELADAIENDEIVVYYQPKYTARDQQLIGAEALVRWQHPDKGLIPPNRFIAVAERCGQIDALETHILNAVCAQVRNWLDAGLDVPCIAVNLSASRIRDPFLPGRIRDCLDAQGLDAKYLMFEITESLAIQEILRAIEILKRFSEMGVNVALDDFGTGHSSLSYLKQLPIQQLKIDRSFITDLGRGDPDQVAIVRSIISLAHILELTVVAEGVETQEQLAYLNEFDCDQVQGYLFSRPVPGELFAARLSATGSASARSHRLACAG